ncbi:MAG: hypothetical protein P8X75_09175 [Limibacillus sp.]|jgi:hypothetical protein
MTWLQFDGVGGSVGGAVSRTTGQIGSQSFELGPLHISFSSPWLWGFLVFAALLVVYVTRR